MTDHKKIAFFTIADAHNIGFALAMQASLKKFHPDIHVHIVKSEELDNYLKQDPNFFYRATPIVAEELLKDYELVIKIDADSIVTGKLDYIFDTEDYDVGCVMNWNRVDPATYGLVQGWGITPVEYVNCGLVAMRSKKFVHHWKMISFTEQFNRLQYREQDLLNILVYYGNYNVRMFDHPDILAKYEAWHGLVSKGEWGKFIMKGGELICPKGEDNFPSKDTPIKIIHWAGGKDGDKMNFKTRFNDEVIDYLQKLIT